jgi:iron complex outermembrane receptor protein
MLTFCPFSRQRLAVAAALFAAACAAPVLAQSTPAAAATPPAAAASDAAVPTLQPVVVTGNPLRSTQTSAAVSVLDGDALVLRRGSSLGDTLEGLPGVSSTYFGPNANRPVVRGQDGDRIRVLSNAGASLDASALSFDHAVPIDPLVVERIEVLRGPAALLYGGSAVGGVVNAIDQRIPRTPARGLSAAGELRVGGADGQRGVSAVMDQGSDGWAWHADAFWRRTDDLHVPRFERPNGAGGTEPSTRVLNAASAAQGGAVGASLVGAWGHLGLSVDHYGNDYGVVAEDDVTIRMKRDKAAVSGEWRDLASWLPTLRVQGSLTDYQHQEVEGSGEVGTTFKNRGGDLRVEAVQARRALAGGTLDGVFGAQAEASRFEALGEEAFVPSTRTRNAAAFWLGQWQADPRWQWSAGLRVERASVDSLGDADPAEAKFGAAVQRRFTPRSASLGWSGDLGEGWRLTGSLSRTERAPTSYELYANGVHAATATFERGDTAQRLEQGRHGELGLHWQGSGRQLQLQVYRSDFGRYIALLPTGEPDFVNADGEAFPVYAFRAVPARLQGWELQGTQRLWQGAGSTLDLEAQWDGVRADNRATGEPLPRIAPQRVKLGLAWQGAAWRWQAEVLRAQAQNRVPEDDLATPGWTQFNVAGSVKWRWQGQDALLFVRLNNLGNALAYSASSTVTVRGLAPLPGRSVSVGLRWTL